jgi:hypothetical protein
MKLRIKGNSLRPKGIALGSCKTSGGRLPGGDDSFHARASAKFTYALQQEQSVSRPTVQYTGEQSGDSHPCRSGECVGHTDQVGIAEDISLGNLGSLALLIEKDFACLDRSEEDNEDTFPNPNAGTTVLVTGVPLQANVKRPSERYL